MSRTICGTPAYVAPEVIMCMEGTKKSYDVRSSPTALPCTLLSAVPRVRAASNRPPPRSGRCCAFPFPIRRCSPGGPVLTHCGSARSRLGFFLRQRLLRLSQAVPLFHPCTALVEQMARQT